MGNKNIIFFVVAIVIQMILFKYCQVGPYMLIAIMPAMILCQPTTRPTYLVTIIAFLCGICVDFLADGTPGLNTAAILPVALLQKPIIRLVIDEDVVDRGYSFSFKNNGIGKIGLALLVETFIFLLVYVALDGMCIQNFGRSLLKILISLAASFPFGLALCSVFCPNN